MEDGYGLRNVHRRVAHVAFSLDVTDADYHSLEAGLQLMAEQTGGFARTHIFPTLPCGNLRRPRRYCILFIGSPMALEPLTGSWSD
jgi:hypothetical protein